MKNILLALAATLLLAACAAPAQQKRPTITVSIEPLRFFTEEIAGHNFRVQTMVPDGMNPETYEPTAQQMARLADSRLMVTVGGIGFERTWMDRLKANAPNTVIVSASEGITPVKTPAGTDDPHTWMSTRNARHMAWNICRAITMADPADSTTYRQRTERLCQRIDSVDTAVRTRLAKGKARAFLIYHPILTYFAADYGLTQIPVEEEGREPGAAQLESTIALARSKGVKTLFVQRQFSESSVRAVGKAVGATETPIDPLSYDWCGEMLSTAEKLK